jgi:hypothetical protein
LRRAYGTKRLLDRLLPTILSRVDALTRLERWDLTITVGMPIGTERVLRRAGIPVRRLYWAPHWPTDENLSMYLSCRQRGGRNLNQLSHWLARKSARLLLGGRLKNQVVKQNEPKDFLDDPFFLKIPSWFAAPEFLTTRTIQTAQHASAIGFLRPLSFPTVSRAVEHAIEFKEKNSGQPHIYAGFGSLKSHATISHLALIASVARRLGIWVWIPKCDIDPLIRKGIKVDHVFPVDPAPHRQLFPLVDGVICHGGIGTILSALDSNRALSIVPHWFDQFYWAHKLSRNRLALAEYALTTRVVAARVLEATLDFIPDRDLLAVCQQSCGINALERDVHEAIA